MCTASDIACIWRASTVSGCGAPPSVSTTCWAKTSGALTSTCRVGSLAAIRATASSSRAEAGRRRPTRSGRQARGEVEPLATWCDPRPAAPRASRSARPARTSHFAARNSRPGRPCLEAGGEVAEPPLVDDREQELGDHRARLDRAERARVGWPAGSPAATSVSRRGRRAGRRRGARRRSGRGRAACAPTPARRSRRAARRCRSRGSRRRPRWPRRARARRAGGRAGRRRPRRPRGRRTADRHHAPMDIGERGLKIRSMLRKRAGRPRSMISSTGDGRDRAERDLARDRAPSARRRRGRRRARRTTSPAAMPPNQK